jgi:hypothetical protein
MGLLDDAIREHLDLKRRRGADPAEVERDERDALGPVRRGPEGSAEVDLEHPAVAGEGLGYDHEEVEYEHEDAGYDLEEPHEYDGAVESEAAAPAPAPPPEFEPAIEQPTQAWHPDDEELFEPGLEEDDLVEDEPIAQAPPAPTVPPAPPPSFLEEPIAAEPPAAHEPPLQEPPAAPPPVRADPIGPLDGETAEYDMPVDSELEEEPTGEDVLEETPEFLQDTPDHDRLWFEQRPPKDFDFDD